MNDHLITITEPARQYGEYAVYQGTYGHDAIIAGAGADTLYGASGDDRLDGGAGNDWLFGSGGADTFVFAPGHGHDVVMDFGGGDTIDLTAFEIDPGELPLSVTDDGVTLDLSDHGGGTVFLLGLDAPPGEDAFLIA